MDNSQLTKRYASRLPQSEFHRRHNTHPPTVSRSPTYGSRVEFRTRGRHVLVLVGQPVIKVEQGAHLCTDAHRNVHSAVKPSIPASIAKLETSSWFDSKTEIYSPSTVVVSSGSRRSSSRENAPYESWPTCRFSRPGPTDRVRSCRRRSLLEPVRKRLESRLDVAVRLLACKVVLRVDRLEKRSLGR